MLKMEIVLTANQDGDLTVAVGKPILFAPKGKKEAHLSPRQKAELKHGSDMILKMIQIWTEKEGIVKDGGQLQDVPDQVMAVNPIAIVEFLVNDMRHNPTNDWDEIKRKLIMAMNGNTFQLLGPDEIQKAVKS